MAAKKSTYYCIVCTKNKENESPQDLPPTLFKFPKSPPRRNIWLEKLQISASEIRYRSRVCERHFKPNQVVNNRLKRDTLPTTTVTEKRNRLNPVETTSKIAPKPFQGNFCPKSG